MIGALGVALGLAATIIDATNGDLSMLRLTLRLSDAWNPSPLGVVALVVNGLYIGYSLWIARGGGGGGQGSMDPEMLEVRLRVPREVDEWFRARGYDEEDYEGMLWGGLAAEMELKDAEGTRDLRSLLEALRE